MGERTRAGIQALKLSKASMDGQRFYLVLCDRVW
jgi:hypothetical protein